MWEQLADYARWAPSPHNTQPTRLKVVDGQRATLLFVPNRGLPVGDPRGRFTYLTFGIVVETMRIAAHARGYELECTYGSGPLYGHGDAPLAVADLRLVPAGGPIDDLDPGLLLRRRTNRLPYDDRPVAPEIVARLRDEARRAGHAFDVATDPAAIRWVKELNRDALYHDLEHRAFRDELASWLRFTAAEAHRRRDGLSAEALAMPGWLLRAFFRHHRLFTAPGLKQLTQQVYLRTMTGIPTVGWVQGNFVDERDWTRAGELMLRLWLLLTQAGVEWQPYGSVITNDAARSAMVEKFGFAEGAEGRDMVWLLVRLGHSTQEPVRSERHNLSEVLI